MHRRHRLLPSIFTLALLAAASLASTRAWAEPVSFSRQIAPLLLDYCQACHGPKRAEGLYRVDSFERALHEGESGDPAVTAGKPKESELLRRLASTDPDERMPKDGNPFAPEQIALVQRWIDEGAKFDGPTPQTPLVTLVPPIEQPPAPPSYARPIPITAVAFSADGQELFVGGFHEITVWNPVTGEPLRRIGRQGQRTFALALTRDNKYLASGSGSPGRLGEVRLFDPASGNLEKVLTRTTDVVYDVAPSPKDNRLALAAADNFVRIFDLDSGQETQTLGNHSDWVLAVAWSPDATKLASGSRDKTARVFDAATGESLATFSGHTDAVRGVVFHPDGAQVFSCGADKRVNLWKVADGTRTSEFKAISGETFKLAGAGEFFFVPSADKAVRQFPLAELKLVRDYQGATDWMLCAAYHPATNRMAAGSFDGSVRVWDVADGKLVKTFIAAPGYVPPVVAK